MRRTKLHDYPIYSGPLRPVMGTSNVFPSPTFANITGWTAANGSAARDTGVGRSGTDSLRLTASSASAKVSYTESGVVAGARKVFRAWLRGNAGAAGKFVRLKIAASDGSFQDTCALKLSDSVWQELWCVWEIPVSGDVTYSVESVDMANTNIVYIDDVIGTPYELPVWSKRGRQVLFNGEPVFRRGSNYNNTPTTFTGSANFGDEDRMVLIDFAELADQGANTIRFYNNSWDRNDYGRALSAAVQYGLSCQMWYFIWIQSNDARRSTPEGLAYRQTKIDDYVVWVNRLKDHPAMQGFYFGSEGNYHVTQGGTDGENNTQEDWFTLVNDCSAAGKEVTTRVLFGTSNGGTPNPGVDHLLPDMDEWGYTVYGGNQAQVFRGSTPLNDRAELIEASTDKPAFLSEIGSGAYQSGMADGNQEYQATTDVQLLRKAEQIYPFLSGALYFQFSDDRNVTNPSDNSWYGKSETVAQGASTSRTKRTAFGEIKKFYRSRRVPNNV